MKDKEFIQTILEIKTQLDIIHQQNEELKRMMEMLYLQYSMQIHDPHPVLPPRMVPGSTTPTFITGNCEIENAPLESKSREGWNGPLPENIKSAIVEVHQELKSITVKKQSGKNIIPQPHRRAILKALKLNF